MLKCKTTWWCLWIYILNFNVILFYKIRPQRRFSAVGDKSFLDKIILTGLLLLLLLLLLNVILALCLRNHYLTKPEKFLLYFLYEVLDITFKPMSDFELMFVWCVDWNLCSTREYPVVPVPLVERLLFLHWMAFAPLSAVCVWLYFGLPFCFSDFFLSLYASSTHTVFFFFWLCQILVVAHWIFVASCELFCCSAWTLVVVHRLSCPVTYGILVPRPGIEPASSAVQGRLLTTGPPGSSGTTHTDLIIIAL